MFLFTGEKTGKASISYPEQFQGAGGKIIDNAARVLSDLLADDTHPKALQDFVSSHMGYSINLLKLLSDSDEEHHKDIIRDVLKTETIVPAMYLHSGADVLKKCLDLQSCEGREDIFATDYTLFTMWENSDFHEDILKWLEEFGFEGRERIQSAEEASGVLFQSGYQDEVVAKLEKARFLHSQQLAL